MMLKSIDRDSNWRIKWADASNTIHQKHPKLKVSVYDPEAVSLGLTKYIVYSLRTEVLKETVEQTQATASNHAYRYDNLVPNELLTIDRKQIRRRFSDFVTLREILLRDYPGLFIPALPTDIGILSGAYEPQSDFIRHRIFQLNYFLSQLCNIPFIYTSPYFTMFLNGDENDFKGVAKAIAKSKDLQVNNEGELVWKSWIDSLPMPSNTSKIINDIKIQVRLLKDVLRGVEDEIMNLFKTSSSHSQQLAATNTKLLHWLEAEKEIKDVKKYDTSSYHDPSLMSHFSAMLLYFNQLASTSQSYTGMVSNILVANMQFHHNQMFGFREFVRQIETFTVQLDKAENDKIALMREKSAQESPQIATGYDSFLKYKEYWTGKLNYEEEIAKKDEEILKLSSALVMTTKSIVYFEMERFHCERTQFVAAMLESLVASQIREIEECKKKINEIQVTFAILQNEVES